MVATSSIYYEDLCPHWTPFPLGWALLCGWPGPRRQREVKDAQLMLGPQSAKHPALQALWPHLEAFPYLKATRARRSGAWLTPLLPVAHNARRGQSSCRLPPPIRASKGATVSNGAATATVPRRAATPLGILGLRDPPPAPVRKRNPAATCFLAGLDYLSPSVLGVTMAAA